MKSDWLKGFEPILKIYGKRPHPLEYKNRYQLIVMVILSARDNDKKINNLAPAFFKAYPDIKHLAAASVEDLRKYLGSVIKFNDKAAWILEIARSVCSDDKIPRTLDELNKLPGIGRKSANVIIRESGDTAEGIIVDLHVLRVAPRIGVATGTNPEKIEKQLMEVFPQERWNEIGMAISYLGREICRPKPKCPICPMKPVCQYFKEVYDKEMM